MPDTSLVIDYNRYTYTRGNPLKYNDPSGHCVNSSTTSQPVEISYDNNECWRLANTIGAMWDSTDYWSNRFTSSEVFFNNVANNGHNGTDFFQGQLNGFFSSDEGKAWLGTPPGIPQHVQDDPHCGGAKACQALLRGMGQVEQTCNQIDCIGVANDVVGVGATASVAVACIPGFAVCGTVAAIGAPIATGSTLFSIGWTSYRWAEGEATTIDLVVTGLTATGGSLAGVDDVSPYVGPIMFSWIQMRWDLLSATSEK